MNRMIQIAFTALIITAVPTATLAVRLEIVSRGPNSLNLQPRVDTDNNEVKVNLQDCIDMLDVDFLFDVTIESSDDTSNRGLYIIAGADCYNSLDYCTIVTQITSIKTQRAAFSLGDLWFKLLEALFKAQTGMNVDIEALLDGGLPDNLDAIVDQGLESLFDMFCREIETKEGTFEIYAALLSDKTNPKSGPWSSRVNMPYDFSPPIAPLGGSTTPGDRKVLVSWNGEGVSDNAGYYVLFAKSDQQIEGEDDAGADIDGSVDEASIGDLLDGSIGDLEECTGPLRPGGLYNSELSKKSVPAVDGYSTSVTGLANGSTYQFAVVSRDDFENISAILQVVCDTPGETQGFFDEYLKSGGRGGGKHCFVATAAYGDYDYPTVRALRRFRDDFLAALPGGEKLIAFYYAVGPALAEVVAGNVLARMIVRRELDAFAGMARISTALGPNGVGAIVLVSLALCIGFVRRRRG